MVSRNLLYLRAYFRGNRSASDYAGDEPPLRSELFSADQMALHGKSLAASHTLTSRRSKDQLITRLAENERILVEVSQLLTTAVTANRRITPAGEWLLDNFYLVQEQIRIAKRHFPQNYSRELPCLAQGPSAGLPRVYDIALETIAHGDGRVDPGSLRRFVAAYQTVTALTLGELWAIPIMLRLALIENLRRVSTQIAADRIDQNHADHWADQMSEIAEQDPKNLILTTADMARSNPPMTTSFVSELVRRLQGQSPALALPLTWIEQHLAESGLTIEQLVQSGTQHQAADQVSISNSISSLRFLGMMDWREFVETMSVVEQTLHEDPAGVYPQMDFATRDRYRHVVEKMAKRSHLSETEIARAAIQLALQAADTRRDTDNRQMHVGFYLIDKGFATLEQAAQPRFSLGASLGKIYQRFPLFFYVGGIALLTAILTGLLVTPALHAELPRWALVLLSAVALISTSQLALSLMNWLAMLLATPHILPRMDFSHGIPQTARSLVVVPTILVNSHNIDRLSENLEVRYLANQDINLRFGLLTDLQDAPTETLPEDASLLQRAQTNIEALNKKYCHADGDIFFLLHRPRRWNARDRIWMGYERKRGKLADLNALLRGHAQDRFSLIVGNLESLTGIKYVITLDTDTQLPRDAARQLVGAMAHPLNRASYDENRQRVTAGYGILQPRVAVSLPSVNRSLYARIHGSESGIDPYTRAVSDIYQDLFSEGSFIGKGIYDVDIFERALNNRFPENRILSHDLLEGCYARSGLLSDVLLYEDYPASYSADVSRRHRWIRGDWQIGRWLWRTVPGLQARSRHKNPLSGLCQWKLLDNLRRSLMPAALLFLFLFGWTVLPFAWFWTLAALAIILVPSVIASLTEMFQKPFDMPLKQHLFAAARSTEKHFTQALFTLACLPYEAIFSLEAIVRTLGRMLITRRRLLEWRTADEASRDSNMHLSAAMRRMWSAPFIAISTALYLSAWKPSVLPIAGSLLILWSLSPAIAWWLSRPLAPREARLSPEQLFFLRKVSRKTWAFFENFMGPEDHWLPPDNYQEQPVSVVAHRTSPTNIGLALLSNLSAHDFGYLGTGQFIERTVNTLNTMESLERHRGHFYNWYDTQSLKPLHPAYISSVDSGNLAGHLLILRIGLLALGDQKILAPRWLEGLQDTLAVLQEALKQNHPASLRQLQADIDSSCLSPPATLAATRSLLEHFSLSAAQVSHAMDQDADAEAKLWLQNFIRQCQNLLDDLTFLAPWTLLPAMPDGMHDLLGIDDIPRLHELTQLAQKFSLLTQNLDNAANPEQRAWINEAQPLIEEASRRAQERFTALENCAARCAELAHMEYDFLYDKARHLLAIGFNVNERRRDSSYYDLLASEARFCTFVAIAQGQLPQESWFALGRQLTTVGGQPVLLSWSGSMFEYLMPLLVMPTYEGTLLDQTYQAAVKRQIEYGAQRGVPWGLSESGYNATDAHLNYQYRAFGAPGLGLKRGLAEDLVIAPYASTLALMVAPEAACVNLQKLAATGLTGKFGFYEAIDYTPTRVPRGQTGAVVQSFMAHHQGMSLLALAYLLLDRPMQKRFESDLPFQATTLLLQERIPPVTMIPPYTVQLSALHPSSAEHTLPLRTFTTPNTPIPEVQLLSNGRYHVMVTNAGGGYSRWKDLAVTRWREDSTTDNGGTFCYLRDVASGLRWSAAYQPTLTLPKQYEAIFTEGRAEFRRRDFVGDGDLDTHTEIVVSPEDDIELRRVHIINRSRSRRTIEVTSYAEIVLAPPAAEALHPTFSNLFVQTEIIDARQAILCTRRPRSSTEATPWMFHLMAVHGTEAGEISYETDRLLFIGRGNSVTDPQALQGFAALSGSQGSVLDPIAAIRCRITLEPDESAKIDIVSGIGETRDAALSLVEKYHDRRLADRVFNLAWTHNQVILRQINATESDAQLYARLANSIVHANAALRADSTVLIKNRRGQSGLWGYAISGDLPIVLLQIKDPANIDLVRQLVQAHAYWRLKGLTVDLVIWNEDHVGYRQLLHEHIMGLIAAGIEANVVDRPGGIFVRPGEQISNEDRILLQTVARAIISDSRGTLEEQISRRGPAEIRGARFTPTRIQRTDVVTVATKPRDDLLLFNGLGGFTRDGREYVISTAHKQVTPAPWANVLANPQFGSVVSESGLGYTWSENAHEFRLTPWHNDPVCDASGEAFYIRDEERGHFWSPTPLPSRGATPYVTRHGFGYSVFEHVERGIRSELWVYVALKATIKFVVLKIRNASERTRKLSVTGYVEWVLGDLRSKSNMHVVTEVDDSGAVFARNAYNSEFPERVAFFDIDENHRTVSGDRGEFIGRNGTLKNPTAMARTQLSGKVGAALDPCGALQVSFELAPGQEREIRFMLGVGQNANDASQLIRQHRGAAAARTALEEIQYYWHQTLETVQVETPDTALNVLGNGWILYQTLACRLWARSGYYQSGGAFGFRDQLQDAMALVHAEPQRLREQLLLCASRQFVEGDVQHWWHPPSGRGVRTQCSDDYLWMPWAACRYVLSTGDSGVLDEPVTFLEGRLLHPEEDSYYDLPNRSRTTTSLYEHCVRAIDRALHFGVHGLPLMGSGDWNDGMNMVGIKGKGESVWLGFFLYDVLQRFSELAGMRGDHALVERCQKQAEQLQRNIEQHAWDGAWYRRAYFDDGTPLGSAANSECQIDSISQSWAVLSGAGEKQRTRSAMQALDKRLVRREHALVQLLDPPFDKSPLNPGYIKGYVPGVRENGGQYTHAAVWSAMAFAALGDGRRAWEILNMINPVNHALSAKDVAIYKVEPYVIAADVYAVAPHTGRGGWTWYTGSAGWMYRLIVESLLGLRLEVDKLHVTPCVPASWKTFKLHYRYRQTPYHITVVCGRGKDETTTVIIDGATQNHAFIPLIDDQREHLVEVRCAFKAASLPNEAPLREQLREKI